MPEAGASGRLVRRVLRLLQGVEKTLCIAAFGILIAVVFADVVSREILGTGIYWAAQTGIWANVLVVMAGFGLASASGGHLRPRFADNWLPQRWSHTLQLLQHLCMAGFCFGIGSVALAVVLRSFELGEVDVNLFLPLWPIQAALPMAFFAAAIRHLLYAIYPELRPLEASTLALGADANSP